MWFEPGSTDWNGDADKVYPVGFEKPPGAEIGSKNHVLNDHTYCCQLGTHVCDSGEPSTDLASECLEWHQLRVYTRAADAKRLQVPFMLSEFGACLTEASCTQEIMQATSVADDVVAGWAYWEFKTYEDLTTSAGTGSEGFYNKDGSLQEWKVKALARTYLQRTQGWLLSQQFNMENSRFEAIFKLNISIDAPSVLFVSHEYYYTEGSLV
jgi:hypothetical protein